MARPILAVIFGTFTLRLSTGLTGGMLVFYLARLHFHGGEEVSAWTVGVLGALFYASELVASPVFGVLSDRIGHRKVMQMGPVFGAVAALLTAFTVAIPVLAATRVLEGLATAASVPSILGFIAFATAGNEVLRGRSVARFEAATLAGLLAGFVLAGPLFRVLGPVGFIFNAGLYAVSLAIYRFGVPKDAEPEPAAAAHDPTEGLRRYLTILKGSHVWVLAPTWIAINATLGLYTGQTLFQLVREPDVKFSNQHLMGGFDELSVSLGLAIGGLLFFAGLLYWGGKFKSLRRTTIILYGIGGGAVMIVAGIGINHLLGVALPLTIVLLGAAACGLFVLAGATPAAIGLLADVTEAYPNDRGAIMGLYSVFLGVGQIVGSLVGGAAAQVAGLDGIFVASLILLGIALLPISQLRKYEHQFSASSPAPAGLPDRAAGG